MVALVSCKKDSKDPEPNTVGTFVLEFDNVVGGSNMQLDTVQRYTNSSGEKFSITSFNYFISNVKLRRADGSEFMYPVHDSTYFLVKESDASTQEVDLFNIPSGAYTHVTFTIGVDSAKSAQTHTNFTGVLNPVNHSNHSDDGPMYWAWASGYIFMKMEGRAEVAETAENPYGKFYYHIGGFGGPTANPINNVRTITLPFPSQVVIMPGRKPQAHLMVDALKVFEGSTRLSIQERPLVMLNPFSTNISNNYKDMFMVHHVH